jgi:asparagine synthase (glutamine-hydrolysing)
MCGFVGRYIRNGSLIKPTTLNFALDLLKHRGPDSSGQCTFDLEPGVLQFGFRRLSIIDLSISGNQPFTSSDKRFVMVFNGEIYNYLELRNLLISKGHIFKSHSDTEVLISAWQEWGIESVRKLIGMFSIIIYDKLKSELWCIRDAYGIKPFFYSYTNDDFSFASEINALVKMNGFPPRMNQDIAMKYIIEGEYDRSVDTFFEGVFQLQPGHYFKIELKKSISIHSDRWWFPDVHEDKSLSFKEAAETLREQFLESIKIHLRSDVRVATALSGGLDSSAIVSAVRKIEPDIDIHTFSYAADDAKINEGKWIDLVNSKTHSIPHLVEISPTDFYNDLNDLIRTQGEPFGSTSLYAQYKIYRTAREAGVTVILDGQGADELLAGYFGYPENRVQSLLDNHEYYSALSLISKWSKWPGRESKYLIRSSAKYLLPMKSQKIVSKYLQTFNHPAFVNKEYLPSQSFSDVYPGVNWNGRRLSQRLLKEQSNGALVSLLRHADRNSMRWSIESRVPFLNTKLSELVMSFPEEYLLNGNGETKSIFREAMRGIVDQRILDRKDKIGFASPQKKWVTRDLLNEESLRDGLLSVDFFDQKLVQRYLAQETIGGSKDMNQKWRIYNLIKWRQIYNIKE